MMQLVCMLEERSAAEMLKVILKKLLPNTVIKCIVVEVKQDMEKRIEKRLRYWQQPTLIFW